MDALQSEGRQILGRSKQSLPLWRAPKRPPLHSAPPIWDITNDVEGGLKGRRIHLVRVHDVPVGISHMPEVAQARPVVFWCRGGNRNFGVPPPSLPMAFGQAILVFSLYRTTDLTPWGSDEFGGQEVEDVKNVVAAFPGIADKLQLNCGKRYLLGESRGALQMFLAMQRYTLPIDGLISLCGVSHLRDWGAYRPDIVQMWKAHFGLTDDNADEWFAKRDPSLGKWPEVPTLVIVCMRDNRVDPQDGLKLAAALPRATLWRVLDAGHALADQGDPSKANRRALRHEIVGWFRDPSYVPSSLSRQATT